MIDHNIAIKNPSHKTNFRMDIPDGNKTRSFQLVAQETYLPGMNVKNVKVALNPMLQGNIPGSGVDFDPLQVRIIIDENFESYTEIFEWMVSTVDYRKNKCTPSSKMPPFLFIHILDNSKRNIVCTFKYYEPFPTSVGTVDFSYMEDGNPSITTSVSFHYKYFEIERNGRTISTRINEEKSGLSLHPSMR